MKNEQVDRCGVCKLCGKEGVPLAKSHIFPWGFFRGMEGANEQLSLSPDQQGRLLRQGLYDRHICCRDCEQSILAPLDEYAISIYRDLCGHIEIRPTEEVGVSFIVIKAVDRKKLRAFVASLLWRCSVSNELEFREFSIGPTYEGRIQADLINDGDFRFVDAIAFSLTSWMHQGITLPCKTKYPKRGQSPNGRTANGFVFQLPHIEFRVSLDQRPHPYSFHEFDFSVCGEEMKTSWSLAPRFDGQALLLYRAPAIPDRLEQVVRIVQLNHAIVDRHAKKVFGTSREQTTTHRE